VISSTSDHRAPGRRAKGGVFGLPRVCVLANDEELVARVGPWLMYRQPPMSSETYHEPLELLSEETRNMHRAIVSLKEELEAVDWYQQRAEACSDEELRGVLVHNKNEEIEHAMMNLEWIRRHSEVFESNIKTYIGSKGPILAVEKAASAAESGGAPAKSTAAMAGLGIGSLKGVK
jgi:uncharacterized protein